MPDLSAFPRTRKTFRSRFSRLQLLLCTLIFIQLLVLVFLLF
jgi:hypothetical protein